MEERMLTYHEIVIVAAQALVQTVYQFLCTASAVVETYRHERHLLVYPADQSTRLIAIPIHDCSMHMSPTPS